MLFIEQNVDKSDFVIGFLTCLHDSSQDIKLGRTEIFDMYKSILSKALKVFQVDTLAQPQPRSSWCVAVKESAPGQSSISWNTMMKLFEQCDTIGIDTSEVLEVLRRRALGLREEALEAMYSEFFLPFINSLCLYLKSRANRPATSTEQNFIVQLIELYLGRHVKTPPKKPTDWERTLTINCSCEDCLSLRRYVEDKHNQFGEFCLTEDRRRHIERSLDGTFRIMKSDPPHTLRIEKSTETYKRDLKSWTRRAKFVESWLTALSELVDIIGEDSSTKLLEHESLKPLKSLLTVRKKRSFVDLSDG
jgi:hypothetical protein